jgi:hypothetical protein
VAILVAVVAGAVYARIWYYGRYVWPADIQERVLGVVVVSADDLVEHTGFSHFGQGMYTWRYRVSDTNAEIIKLCSGRPIATCSFIKWKQLDPNVKLSVGLADGVLTLEEDWT